MKRIICISIFVFFVSINYSSAQNRSSDYLKMRWGYVATRMPEEWYGSEEAKSVAENVLISQKEIGGWAKNKPYHHVFTQEEIENYKNGKLEIGGTFDNGSTITELKFLAKIYAQIPDERYKSAFEKGVNYIFQAQYANGGWPQYFPVKNAEDEVFVDHTQPYSMHITYNDNAMVNIMLLLKGVFTNSEEFAVFDLNEKVKEQAKITFDKGIECILNTQIVVDGKPSVWCAQHHEVTLAPANARSYELASFSGSESVGIIMLLMDIEHPSEQVILSVKGAVNWFENHKIEGIRIDREILPDGKRNRIVVEDKNASALWGRFYDLNTEKVFFCDRDGIKKNSLAEIGYERRNGYSWYTDAPQIIINKYPEWLAKKTVD